MNSLSHGNPLQETARDGIPSDPQRQHRHGPTRPCDALSASAESCAGSAAPAKSCGGAPPHSSSMATSSSGPSIAGTSAGVPSENRVLISAICLQMLQLSTIHRISSSTTPLYCRCTAFQRGADAVPAFGVRRGHDAEHALVDVYLDAPVGVSGLRPAAQPPALVDAELGRRARLGRSIGGGVCFELGIPAEAEDAFGFVGGQADAPDAAGDHALISLEAALHAGAEMDADGRRLDGGSVRWLMGAALLVRALCELCDVAVFRHTW